MARTVRDAKLESRTGRAALKPAAKPYYRALDEGLHLGYRRNKVGGKWVLRRRAGGTYVLETLATADDAMDADGAEVLTFSQAQALARARFVELQRVAAGLPAQARGPYTVRIAIEEYLGWMESNHKTVKETRSRAEALILPTLGAIECSKLTTAKLRAWRDATAKAPPRLRTKPGQPQNYRTDEPEDPEEALRKRKASTNRTLTILKAALNHGWREQKIPSDQAWRALGPFEGADAARIRYLTVIEAQRLIGACDADFGNLVRAALATGCRYSELAALRIEDFNPDSGTVHVRKSKSGKARHVILNEEGQKLLATLSKDRPGRAYLLVKDGAGRWLKSHQTRPMADACKAAEIEPISFHGLRHSYASLSIMAGAPLMVVAKNLGHVDTRMVEKHYGHMSPSYVADAMRAAAPNFEVRVESKIVAVA
jgi:integrase